VKSGGARLLSRNFTGEKFGITGVRGGGEVVLRISCPYGCYTIIVRLPIRNGFAMNDRQRFLPEYIACDKAVLQVVRFIDGS